MPPQSTTPRPEEVFWQNARFTGGSGKMNVVTILTTILVFSQAASHSVPANWTNGGRIHSRRKRYLSFPEGSSLQLVYCLTVPTIIPSTIFNLGWTAGLAWELPSDAKVLLAKKFKHRTTTTTTTEPPHHDYHDDYHHQYQYLDYDPRKKYPYKQMHEGEVMMHRRDRRQIYSKAETLLNSLGLEGRSCILRALCESGQKSETAEKGTFHQELLRVLFTLPRAHVEDLDEGDLRHYDAAHQQENSVNCAEIFPDCNTSLLG